MRAFAAVLLISPLTLCLPVAAAEAGLTVHYTVLSNGDTAGQGEDTYRAGGRVDCHFEYNDRGRGPKVEAHYTLGPDGLQRQLRISGNDYLKSPVDERYDVTGGRGRWHSAVEHGSAPAGGFYVSNYGPPSELAMLAAAVLKTKNGRIALRPAGEAHIERIADTTVQGNDASLHVTAYAITGLGFEPSVVWLDDQRRFFAIPGKWQGSVRAGFESVNEQLLEIEQKADDKRLSGLAATLARHPQGSVAIEHVRVFDAEHASMLEDQTVLVSGERIAVVGPASTVDASGAKEHIDGRGKTLLPGLFDMHAHITPLDGMLNIAAGVTSVRDVGNDIELVSHLQQAWQSGGAIGPRVWKAGIIDGHGPFQVPTGLYADTLEQAIAAVDRYADLGYVQIKLYSSLNPEFVAPMAKEAHARGLRLSGHVPNGMIASQFIAAGADEIQHMNFIFLNFFTNRVKDTRTPERFTAVGENAAGLDLHSAAVENFIHLLKEHHTTLDITLATFEPMFVARPGVAAPQYARILERLPAQVQRSAYGGGLPATGAKDALYKRSYAAMLAMAERLYEAGVPILAGTDDTAGFALHRELELEVAAGIPPNKALQIATWNAASLLKQTDELGAITSGRRADLLLVDGNPMEQISDIRRGRLVIKNGLVYDSDAVYAALGVRPVTR